MRGGILNFGNGLYSFCCCHVHNHKFHLIVVVVVGGVLLQSKSMINI